MAIQRRQMVVIPINVPQGVGVSPAVYCGNLLAPRTISFFGDAVATMAVEVSVDGNEWVQAFSDIINKGRGDARFGAFCRVRVKAYTSGTIVAYLTAYQQSDD